MKNLVRRLVFPFIPEYIPCREGTLKFKFLMWLYGDDGVAFKSEEWEPKNG